MKIIMQLITKQKPRTSSKKVNIESEKYGNLKPKYLGENNDTHIMQDIYSELGETFTNSLIDGISISSILENIDENPIYKKKIKKTEYYTPEDTN